jgi:hypothetical protein
LDKYPAFLLAEDAALRRRISGLFVSDDKEPVRNVQVFYRHPEKETEKTFPYATIELLDISFAPERAVSEVNYYFAGGVGLTPEQQDKYTSLDYYPSHYDASDLASLTGASGFVSTEQFVPVDLLYQITTHTRNPVHQRQLDGLMLRRVFPLRRGFIEIPEDGTIRRCQLLDWRSSDILDQEAGQKKHLFRSVYTIEMGAEIPQADLIGLQRVLEVQHSIMSQPGNEPAPTDPNIPFTEDF